MNKGKYYEEKGNEFLRLQGYKILECNFNSRFGEIDIIAQDNKFLSFVEIRARKKNYLLSPIESVDRRKRDKIRKTALFYSAGKSEEFYRFDVLEVIQGDQWREFRLIKNAFGLYEEV